MCGKPRQTAPQPSLCPFLLEETAGAGRPLSFLLAGAPQGSKEAGCMARAMGLQGCERPGLLLSKAGSARRCQEGICSKSSTAFGSWLRSDPLCSMVSPVKGLCISPIPSGHGGSPTPWVTSIRVGVGSGRRGLTPTTCILWLLCLEQHSKEPRSLLSQTFLTMLGTGAMKVGKETIVEADPK